jgi:hypothetical protein
MSPPHGRRGAPEGPPENRPATVDNSAASLEAAADIALRVAWLRVHADLLEDIDGSGRLSAYCRDFADLLEVTEQQR